MKSFSILCFIWLISASLFNIYGQNALNKGTYSISGSIQYSSTSQRDNYSTYTQNTGTISPQFVYFIKDHISVGGAVSYNYYYSKEPGDYYGDRVTNTSYITVGPSFRYYFYVKKIVPFLEASFSYGIYGLNQQAPEHVYNYGIKGGLEFFLSGSVTLEPFVSYNRIKYTAQEYNFTFNQNANVIAVGAGINYFIF